MLGKPGKKGGKSLIETMTASTIETLSLSEAKRSEPARPPPV